MSGLIYADFVYYLQGLGFRIHNALKGGHDEKTYEAALVWLLDKDKVPFQRQPVYAVAYKGQQVGRYRPDLVAGAEQTLLELKAVPTILAMHEAQALSYLGTTGLQLALIMNFGAQSCNTSGCRISWTSANPFAGRQPRLIRFYILN